MDRAPPIAEKFRRHRFVVEIEGDESEILEQVPAENARAALQSEITSNLESLRGIRTVTVEPA